MSLSSSLPSWETPGRLDVIIVQPGMYFQKLKFSVTFDPNAVYTSFFYHTIALEILYPSIYFLCPRLAQKASFEDTRQFR